jgi:hypothetical protein
VLALSLFLLAAVAFAVDIANFWFHRQTAQNAADAACTAGAMDMLAGASTGNSGQGGFTAGASFDCASASSAAPCRYAALNGYSGANTTPGNQVVVSFPGISAVPGLDASNLPPTWRVPSPIMRVDVVDHVKTFFSGLLTGRRTQDVRAFSVCGLVLQKAPVPLIILKPNCSNTFQVTGSGTTSIIGGPSRSIQVNSSFANAAAVTGNGSVDLSAGGENFTGSSFATFGGPPTAPSGFDGGTTGSWEYPVSPISDPYAAVVAPSIPPASLTNGGPIAVGYADPV